MSASAPGFQCVCVRFAWLHATGFQARVRLDFWEDPEKMVSYSQEGAGFLPQCVMNFPEGESRKSAESTENEFPVEKRRYVSDGRNRIIWKPGIGSREALGVGFQHLQKGINQKGSTTSFVVYSEGRGPLFVPKVKNGTHNPLQDLIF